MAASAPAGLQGLTGRVAFVSGAGQGIGRATAQRLAREGAQVCVNDIDPGTAGAVAEEVGGLSAPCDVSDLGALREQIARCERERGPIDLLVANHAFMVMAPFVTHGEAEFTRTLEVNLLGTAWLLSLCAPAMAARGYGRIVAIASEWGQIGWPNATTYLGPHPGVGTGTRPLGRQCLPRNVRGCRHRQGIGCTDQSHARDPDGAAMHGADRRPRRGCAVGHAARTAHALFGLPDAAHRPYRACRLPGP